MGCPITKLLKEAESHCSRKRAAEDSHPRTTEMPRKRLKLGASPNPAGTGLTPLKYGLATWLRKTLTPAKRKKYNQKNLLTITLAEQPCKTVQEPHAETMSCQKLPRYTNARSPGSLSPLSRPAFE